MSCAADMSFYSTDMKDEAYEEREAVPDDEENHRRGGKSPHCVLDDSSEDHINDVGVTGEQVQNPSTTVSAR